MKLRLGQASVVAFLALVAFAASAEATHLPNCIGHDTPCEPGVPPPDDKPDMVGKAKVIPQAPKAPGPSFLDEIGAFLGDVGDGMGKGVAAVGKGAAVAFAAIGGLILASVRPIAALLVVIWPAAIPLPVYAGMTAAGTAAVAGGAQAGAWYVWRRFLPLGLPVLSLFSRIEKDELLEHERRARIFELIKQNPGVHLSEIARELDYAWGTTLHHLRKLRADRLVVFRDIGHHKSFFVNGSGLSEKQMEAMSMVKNGTLAHLAHYLEAHPRVSLKELSEALNISPPLAAFHVRKLEKAGFVRKVRDGKSVRLSTTEAVPAGFFTGLASQAAPATTAIAAAG